MNESGDRVVSSQLFSSFRLAGMSLENRIVVSPMCQYSAEDGRATDWHLIHLGMLACSGAGMVILEATGVESIGRITPWCLGLWSDDTERALGRVIEACRRWGSARLGIQLGHAGRKGSADQPWKGGRGIPPGQAPGWQTVAPSSVPFGPDWPEPQALEEDDLRRIEAAFAQAARRAVRLGFDLIELHGAHGYLMHQFLSPVSNRRQDAYGGSLENRMRFPLRVFAAVREVVPPGLPLGMRISATDWIDGGWNADEAVVFCRELKALGADFIDVSTGGITADAAIPVGPGFQVPFAERIRREADIATIAVGMLHDPHLAESVVTEGKADLVAVARALLSDPHWPWRAAQALGAEVQLPPQYHRAAPGVWPPR